MRSVFSRRAASEVARRDRGHDGVGSRAPASAGAVAHGRRRGAPPASLGRGHDVLEQSAGSVPRELRRFRPRRVFGRCLGARRAGRASLGSPFGVRAPGVPCAARPGGPQPRGPGDTPTSERAAHARHARFRETRDPRRRASARARAGLVPRFVELAPRRRAPRRLGASRGRADATSLRR